MIMKIEVEIADELIEPWAAVRGWKKHTGVQKKYSPSPEDVPGAPESKLLKTTLTENPVAAIEHLKTSLQDEAKRAWVHIETLKEKAKAELKFKADVENLGK